jgi:hypothetical protein
MQFPLPIPLQFVPQFPLSFPFTWHELFSPAKGQEMPVLFKARAIPARSRTSATIGYLFIICLHPLPYEAGRLRFFYLYFIMQPS